MELIDKAKKVTGSDAETAKLIGLSRFVLSHVRSGRRQLSPYQAAKLAEIVGERWHDHALPIMADLAKSDAERSFWLGKFATLAQTAGKVSAGVFLTMLGVFHSPETKASDLSTHVVNDVYIAHHLIDF